MTFVWSKIQDTPLAIAARQLISDNIRAHYHNLQHVEAIYNHLADTNEPYSESLDWAVLFHDIVYDEKPDKELRSALQFLALKDVYIGCGLGVEGVLLVVRKILNTERHDNLECPMVRADLHQLADPVMVMYNFMLLMREAIAIYGIGEKEFAEATEHFMYGLTTRIASEVYNYTPNKKLWEQILDGIASTIELAKMIQGK